MRYTTVPTSKQGLGEHDSEMQTFVLRGFFFCLNGEKIMLRGRYIFLQKLEHKRIKKTSHTSQR